MKDNDKRQIFAALGTASTIGLNLAAAVAVGIFGGRMLDSWLGSSPWATVAGIVIGLIAGLWATYKQVLNK